MNNQIYPFDLLMLPNNGKKTMEKPFIEKVVKTLQSNLQEKNDVGCKIEDCHTHVGSKIHFNAFTEAELLFHNNYYNRHFAELTLQYILNDTEINLQENKILLIGYENYSELYLHALKDRITKVAGKDNICDYCVYETVSKTQMETRMSKSKIRKFATVKTVNGRECIYIKNGSENILFPLETTHLVFIVPINTTLSTLDKMVAKFVESIRGSVAKQIQKELSDEEELCKEEIDRKINENASIYINKLSSRLHHICLITLCGQYPLDNVGESTYAYKEFWDFSDDEHRFISPMSDKFEFLTDSVKIRNLLSISVEGFTAKKCEKCVPKTDIESESPMFGVDRGSVVPMLKVGAFEDLEPMPPMYVGGSGSTKDEDKSKKSAKFKLDSRNDNLKKVWRLSEFLIYNHIERTGNHYQFHFLTDEFLEQEVKIADNNSSGAPIFSWLKEVRDEIFSKDFGVDTKDKENVQTSTKSVQIFDYLVSPRHSTNSLFVHLVNKEVFHEEARIIYFDPGKEYRSNIKAKYSDLTAALENIESCGKPYKIRFHFVDDAISSGNNFLRAKDLLTSLTKHIGGIGAGAHEEKSLFDSAILLIDRHSADTRNFYVSTGRYFKYIDVNISTMRNHEDACTLCKLGFDYDQIRANCATNRLANICTGRIHAHKLKNVGDIAYESKQNIEGQEKNRLEKRFLFFITHLLEERLSNKLYFKDIDEITKKGDIRIGHPVDIEQSGKSADTVTIRDVLESYYNASQCAEMSDLIENVDLKNHKLIWEIAFIKTISRPFFIYHLRCRQAAFSFCINRLSRLIEQVNDENVINISNDDIMLIQTLVKALSDMNANYIMRRDVIAKLFSIAKLGDIINVDGDRYVAKRVFTSESLLHYIKKDLFLSRDQTKSMLLEYVLLEDSEANFFATGKDLENKTRSDKLTVDFVDYVDNLKTVAQGINLRGKLYLENNIILKEVFDNTSSLSKLKGDSSSSVDNLYFFENFKDLWALNTGNNLKDSRIIFEKYNQLKTAINDFAKEENETREELSKKINELFRECLKGKQVLRTQLFVHDAAEDNELFQFFTISGNPAVCDDDLLYNDVRVSQAFFHDDNVGKLWEVLHKAGKKADDIIFIDDTLTQNKQSLIVRFGTNRERYSNQSNKSDAFVNNSTKENYDESIYLQIWGFDALNIRHWFALKLLLTLRNDFVHLIERVNLQELIEKRKVQMQRRALVINKAATHKSSSVYLSHCIKGVNLYDQYFHVMANEFISSIYRKVIKNDKKINCFESPCEISSIIDDMFKGIKNFSSDKKQQEFKLYIPDVKDTISIEIQDRRSGKDQSLVKIWSRCEGEISGIAHVLYLLAVNAMKHSLSSRKKILIEITDDNISFSNDIFKTRESKEKYDTVKQETQKNTLIPPWVFNQDNQHITLWTLHQYNKKRKQEKEFCAYMEIDYESMYNNKFVVKFKLKETNNVQEHNLL